MNKIKKLNEEMASLLEYDVADKVAQSARYARAALDDVLLEAELNGEEKNLIEDVKELLRNMIPELQ